MPSCKSSGLARGWGSAALRKMVQFVGWRLSGKKKAHKHKLFDPVALGPNPRFSPCFTQRKSSLSQGQTQFVPNTIPGMNGDRKSLCVKLYVPFPLASLVGVWFGGVWNDHFPEPKQYLSGVEIRNVPEISPRCLPNFRLPNLSIRSPKKQFHTPSQSYPHETP